MKSVVMVERQCGATTKAAYHVSVVDSGETPPRDANAAVIDCSAGCRPDPGWIVWEGASAVRFRFTSDVRLFRQESRVRGVEVSYRAGE